MRQINKNTESGLRKLFNAYNSVKLSTDEKKSIVKDLKLKGYNLSEISDITKINKGQISQIINNKEYNTKNFNFYEFIEIGCKNLKNVNKIPLTTSQKIQIDLLILSLVRIKG